MVEKIFPEENENKPVNISIKNRSVKSLRFKDISSSSQVFYKKVVLVNITKFAAKHLHRNLFFDKIVGVLQNISEYFFAKHLWVTASAKYLLFIMSTSATKCYPWPWLFSDDYQWIFSEQKLWIAARSCFWNP